jgi:transposase
MMGRLKQDQQQLFYSFNLDEAVPDDHFVRKIAAVLDLSWVHDELASHYSPLGRPSIDPVLMIRMLILGYVFAIRSGRKLLSPKRSLRAREKTAKPSVGQVDLNLGEGFAVDASLIEADANKGRSIPGGEWNNDIDPETARRAVKEYLATLEDPAYGCFPLQVQRQRPQFEPRSPPRKAKTLGS